MHHPHNITASETRLDGRPANPYAGVVHLRRVPSVWSAWLMVAFGFGAVVYTIYRISFS